MYFCDVHSGLLLTSVLKNSNWRVMNGIAMATLQNRRSLAEVIYTKLKGI
jgi:hypothetical protein